MIKNKKKIKIKVTDDSIEIEGDEDKALDVVRELIKQKKEDQAQKILNDLLAGNKLV
jgi:lactam utilization protein B